MRVAWCTLALVQLAVAVSLAPKAPSSELGNRTAAAGSKAHICSFTCPEYTCILSCPHDLVCDCLGCNGNSCISHPPECSDLCKCDCIPEKKPA